MSAEQEKPYRVTKFGEGQTADGQFVRFQVKADGFGDTDAVVNAQEALGLFSHLDTVQSLPTTKKFNTAGTANTLGMILTSLSTGAVAASLRRFIFAMHQRVTTRS
jgi:hypothetical protein